MGRPQRIAFVCPRFAEGGTVGGAETLLKSLAERAAAAGARVTFLTTCAQSHHTWKNTLPAGRRRVGNLDVQFFPVDEDRNAATFLRVQQAICLGGPVAREEEETWIRNSVNSRALLEHLRAHGAEYERIVAGPYLFGVIFFACQVQPARTLLVPCLHDEPFAHLGLIRELFTRVAGLLFNTEPERELARRLYPLPDERCRIVGMGLEPFEADPGTFAARHELRAPYLLYSGRREGGKGIPLLSDYLHAYRQRTGADLKLVFTGSGPIEAPPELLPHILDVGFVSEQAKHEAMAGALAFVHPSMLESLGIVLLESFLARTPALVNARSEVLRWQCRRSGAGLWFRNYPEFEEALTYLLTHADVRRQMGAAGRAFVLREYAWDRVLDRFFQALETLGGGATA